MRRLFRIVQSFLRIGRIFDFQYFLRPPDQPYHALSEQPELLEEVERLFQSELSSRYSAAQKQLLLGADIMILARDQSTQELVAYLSANYNAPGSLQHYGLPLICLGHAVVARSYQNRGLINVMFLNLLSRTLGLARLFRKIGFVARTNNRHLYQILKRTAMPRYRSDHLIVDWHNKDHTQAVGAIEYLHQSLFQLPKEELLFGQPMKIKHRFDEDSKIEELAADDIIYLYGIGTVHSILTNRNR